MTKEIRAPFAAGERVEDGATRRSMDALVANLNRSGVTRRFHAVVLGDGSYAEPVLYQDLQDTNADTISSTTYASLTGSSIIIEPAPGVTYIVHVTGEALFTDTAKTDGWLSIHDGTTRTEMRTTIDTDLQTPISVSYVVRITARTTFVLQAKKNAGGDSDYSCSRRHISVMAVPQVPRHYVRPETFEVCLRSPRSQREVLRGVWLVRASTLSRDPGRFYTIRAGVRTGDKAEWLAKYDGRTQSVKAGVPLPLHGSSSLDVVLSESDVMTVEVSRSGFPDRLDFTTVEFETEIIGG